LSEFSEILETFFDSFMRGKIHTALPGKIEKVVSESPPIVNVQPGFMRLREGADAPEPRPVVPNVPLVYPVFGEYGVLSKPVVGDSVLLVVAERAVKTWVEQGDTVDPGTDRMFDISDAIAIPGMSHKNVSWTMPDSGIAVGALDGSAVVQIADGKVTTKADETVIQEGADYAVQFTAMKTAFDNLVTAFDAHTHSYAGMPSGTGTTAPPAPSGATMDDAKVEDVRLP
jgi:hypothetical protein